MLSVVTVCLSIHRGSPYDHTWTCSNLFTLGPPPAPAHPLPTWGSPSPRCHPLPHPHGPVQTCSWEFLLWDLFKLIHYVSIIKRAVSLRVKGLLVNTIVAALLFFKSLSTFRQFFQGFAAVPRLRRRSAVFSWRPVQLLVGPLVSANWGLCCTGKMHDFPEIRNTQMQCMVTESS